MHVLALRRFGVAFGPQVVLANVTLDVSARGVLVLVGPTASGKSTLLRTLAGLNDPQPALRTWGEALFDGRPIALARPAIVTQHARLLVASVWENLVSALPDRAQFSRPEQHARVSARLDELGEAALIETFASPVIELPLGRQRRVAIVRATLSEASTILVDEPTAGVTDEEVAPIVALLRAVAEHRAVVVTTHHQGHAAALGGRLALLAGGRVQEVGETEAFLREPTTELGRAWRDTGHCPVPSPSARPDELADGVPRPTPLPESTRRTIASAHEPRGFFWLVAGQLAGMPRPGVVSELSYDLEGLSALGITRLVTLEEERTVAPELLAAYGIASEHVPIPDMHAPSIAQAEALCRKLDGWSERGERVAVHCLAGLGRTGTVLAAHAIWRGASALEAIDRVRTLRPRTIQSDAQVAFLEAFERR